jgi:hypothetical protein
MDTIGTTQNQFFARTKNGIAIIYDPVRSHAATHFADTPHIIPFVKQILENTEIVTNQAIVEFDADTGQDLGNSDLVETDDADKIVYAIRKNRDHYTRFTKSRSPQPTSRIAVSLARTNDTTYNLYSAWLGPMTPPFPDSALATADSAPFWSNHALAWGNQEIQPGTETDICPW